jgi:dolichol kinase
VVRSELAREFGRKAFHQLSLAYLCAFWWFGWPRIASAMSAWLAVVLVIETARLYVPAVERFLLGLMGGLMRESERRHYSGIIFTTVGTFAAMLIAEGDPVIVSAAILQLSLADTASALAGKAFGKTKLFGGPKTLEGSLAGLAVGFAAAIACGVRPGAALAAAFAGTLAELLPTTPWYNDNLAVPVASATALRLMGAA